MEMGYHLNFRDPDGIPLELYVPNELMQLAGQALMAGTLSKQDIADFVTENIDPDYAVR